MSRDVNKVILLGRVGRDPETKYTPSGSAVTTFSLATTDRYKDKSGEWQDVTSWHNIATFGRTAEVASEYVKKGSRLYIEGSIKTSSWDDSKTGEKKYKTEVNVSELILLDDKGGDSSAKRTESKPKPAAKPAPKPADDPGEQGITDDDISW